ncbi:MAG TPA: hypothetical protein VK337_18795 [Xanthobacteraceae bacterium]|nr:hypothetical protein [Xanthobacteraceae bacterium]
MSAAADAAGDLSKPATAGGLVVPLVALVEGMRRDLDRANASEPATGLAGPAHGDRVAGTDISHRCTGTHGALSGSRRTRSAVDTGTGR